MYKSDLCMSQHCVPQHKEGERRGPRTLLGHNCPLPDLTDGNVWTHELGPLETDYGEELGCPDAYRSGQLVPPHPLKKKTKPKNKQ